MPNEDADLKSFHSFILRLQGGAINDMLNESMKKVIQEISDACMDRGGVHKGSVSLKLEFKMDQKDKIIEVFPTVDEKLPKAPLGRAGMFWVNGDGTLTRENPRQMTFEDELQKKRDENRFGSVGHAD